jgi:drug/metabolite transporter (DMT)-like permease
MVHRHPDTASGTRLAIGIACGVGAALCWAAGFVAATHGLAVGMSPADLTIHRFLWAGLVLLPLVWRGLRDLNGIGWGRGALLALLGGPGIAILSYSGFLLVPLGHGGVIQPSCVVLGGLLLATVWLRERLIAARVAGALVIIVGLAVIGGEAVATIGAHGVVGDLMFVTAGLMFATFGTLLRFWRIVPMTGTAVISVLSLLLVPLHWALGGFAHMLALGWHENLLQAIVQGVLAGPAAVFLFARSVALLGAARATIFPALVPPSTLLIGWLALGQAPTPLQLTGLGIVFAGFLLAQKP